MGMDAAILDWLKMDSPWIGGSPTTKDVCEVCGDGIVIHDTLDNCDDGNKIDGDGCNSSWIVEKGWICSGGSPISIDICKSQCGDGIIVPLYEEWDDNNLINDDGWSSLCLIETGFLCNTSYSSLINSVWYEFWGDGKNYGLNLCDDGNTKNGDGWSSTCTIESGFICSGGTPSRRDTWIEICGDSKYYSGNECDDGNIINNDGWSSTCELEKCYHCVGGSPTSKDTWSLLYITPNITSISIDNTITVSFSHSMNQSLITLNDLQITIDSSYFIDYSWSSKFTDSHTLIIKNYL